MPYPHRQLRDALGLVRLLYLAEDRLPGDASRITTAALLRTGEALAAALQRPNAATLVRALAALEAAVDLDLSADARELLVIAADRVRGRPREMGDQEHPAKRARRMRG